MARELQLRDSSALVKLRNPWAVALLPFITLGIYHFVWWYRINREMRDYGLARGYDLGRNPTNSLLALIPGSLIVIPPFVSYYNGTKRVQGSSRVAGREPLNGWIALILFVVISPAYWAYLQVSLNHAWLAESDVLPGQAPLEAPDEMPPRLPEAERARMDVPDRADAPAPAPPAPDSAPPAPEAGEADPPAAALDVAAGDEASPPEPEPATGEEGASRREPRAGEGA